MKKQCDHQDETNPSVLKKERLNKGLDCAYCKPNKGENAGRVDESWKSHRNTQYKGKEVLDTDVPDGNKPKPKVKGPHKWQNEAPKEKLPWDVRGMLEAETLTTGEVFFYAPRYAKDLTRLGIKKISFLALANYLKKADVNFDEVEVGKEALWTVWFPLEGWENVEVLKKRLEDRRWEVKIETQEDRDKWRGREKGKGDRGRSELVVSEVEAKSQDEAIEFVLQELSGSEKEDYRGNPAPEEDYTESFLGHPSDPGKTQKVEDFDLKLSSKKASKFPKPFNETHAQMQELMSEFLSKKVAYSQTVTLEEEPGVDGSKKGDREFVLEVEFDYDEADPEVGYQGGLAGWNVVSGKVISYRDPENPVSRDLEPGELDYFNELEGQRSGRVDLPYREDSEKPSYDYRGRPSGGSTHVKQHPWAASIESQLEESDALNEEQDYDDTDYGPDGDWDKKLGKKAGMDFDEEMRRDKIEEYKRDEASETSGSENVEVVDDQNHCYGLSMEWKMVPASGDGWNEPREPAHAEITGMGEGGYVYCDNLEHGEVCSLLAGREKTKDGKAYVLSEEEWDKFNDGWMDQEIQEGLDGSFDKKLGGEDEDEDEPVDCRGCGEPSWKGDICSQKCNLSVNGVEGDDEKLGKKAERTCDLCPAPATWDGKTVMGPWANMCDACYEAKGDKSVKGTQLNKPAHEPKEQMEEPSMEQLEEWVYDGVAEATDGCRVEPDGTCPHGKNSWLLEMGLMDRKLGKKKTAGPMVAGGEEDHGPAKKCQPCRYGEHSWCEQKARGEKCKCDCSQEDASQQSNQEYTDYMMEGDPYAGTDQDY